MDPDRTKLAVRVVVGGFRSAKATGEQLGGSRGEEIAHTAKTRASQILDEIDESGTDADEEKREARREVNGGSRRAFKIDVGSSTPR